MTTDLQWIIINDRGMYYVERNNWTKQAKRFKSLREAEIIAAIVNGVPVKW